ncbi:HTH-type transcriptional regulator CysB [Aliiroseovarius pelagivivens]|uniref:HTH-type transcriptional regulator CysB n=1 Tax=Aliiroseovarius pelagivivens TaxID=1639690 RepID=A0A2R8ASC2_9RHOB|nr:LysR family transcriptional regulator [Aliiroseovarius pelagivivens]SPF78961.1 HTH-type transcriptional regulator CysB [Aliiroseovarius pelagivivens]
MALRFTLRQLEYFVAVGEEGSISHASERVNVSSPSISAAISQLEDEFGLPLFVRKHAHGLSLTQAGRQFMAQAKQVLQEADALNRLAGDISGNVQGPLNIGCLVTFAQVLLPAIRRQFELKYPDVRVSQIETDQLNLIEQLRRAQIDVALSYDLEIPPDLEFVPLRSLPPYAMVPEGHPLARQNEVEVAELLDYPMVLLDLPLSSNYFLSFFDQTGRKPRIVERTRDMAVMRSMVANGFGYAIANIRPYSDLSPDGRRLVFIPLKGEQRPMRLGLIVPEGARSVLTVNAFIDHAATVIRDWNYPGSAIPPKS